MKIVCISDTHEKHRLLKVPDGDMLIHSGDFTMLGDRKWVEDFNEWLGELPHKHKIVIPGNHDFGFEVDYRRIITPEQVKEYEGLLTNCVYLNDSGITIEGLNIWGKSCTTLVL